jgi:hypothetical protein
MQRAWEGDTSDVVSPDTGQHGGTARERLCHEVHACGEAGAHDHCGFDFL